MGLRGANSELLPVGWECLGACSSLSPPDCQQTRSGLSPAWGHCPEYQEAGGETIADSDEGDTFPSPPGASWWLGVSSGVSAYELCDHEQVT